MRFGPPLARNSSTKMFERALRFHPPRPSTRNLKTQGSFIRGWRTKAQVFSTTTPATLSGCFAAHPIPMGPPQSWITGTTRVGCSSRSTRPRSSMCRSSVYQRGSRGLSLRPKPTWSGTITRYRGERRRMNSRYR